MELNLSPAFGDAAIRPQTWLQAPKIRCVDQAISLCHRTALRSSWAALAQNKPTMEGDIFSDSAVTSIRAAPGNGAASRPPKADVMLECADGAAKPAVLTCDVASDLIFPEEIKGTGSCRMKPSAALHH